MVQPPKEGDQTMAADPSLHEQFIQLRAEGQTCAEIAQELNLSRHTCVNWTKKFKLEIAALRAVYLEALQTEFLVRAEQRIELIGSRFKSINDEVNRRDLTRLPTDKLFILLLKFNAALRREDLDPYAGLDDPDTLAATLESAALAEKNEQNVNKT
jgi:hypothetical protein